ncbi:MAG: hypothetical protein Q8O45_00570 [Desulfurivibrionaceae bacterium]|jgi:hypothetical protein|nr:hypothetical protein [Desulfurivibrionaceae bacterium]
MKRNRSKELREIAGALMNRPELLDAVNAEIQKMFEVLGFALTPEEKTFVLKFLLEEQKKAKNFQFCAGDGARCCSQR